MNDIREKEDREIIGDDAELVQLVGMKLGEEEYAIDVLKIQEIIRTVEITVVPRVESYILGVMNLRGKVIPVIDLRVRFSLDKCDFDKSTRIIVVRFEKQSIGFVVDEVTEVIRIRKSMVEPTPPLVGSIGQEYILGICKYDSRLIMLLDIDRVLNESGEQIESELRKKMLGSTAKAQPQSPLPLIDISIENDNQQDEESDEKPFIADEVAVDLPKPDEVPSPVILTVEEPAVEAVSSDSDVEEDIDALIAKELAKREAETEELNKKKRKSAQQSNEEVLADALAQSSAIFAPPAGGDQHVDQDDLDYLIAKELAKREAETEDLNQRRRKEREESEKKNDINIIDSDNSFETVKDSDVQDAEAVSEETAAAPAQHQDDSDTENVSIQELKFLAEKIISGEEPDSLNIDIKGEIGELLRLIIDTKMKVDEINPVIKASQETIPNVASVLEDVNDTTEKATINLMDASDSMSAFYKNFIEDVKTLKTLANKEKDEEFYQLYSKTCDNLSLAEDLGFKILEALEFQDITEQKLRKVIKSIEDMGARIGAIVGFLQVQQPKNDKWAEKLLEDYGLA
ncbi:MAG: chemotaxis protein CheW [Deferribacterales bacterium]|nr:chemotaxis protein CheW [Deferribacterales bacterium]